MTKRKVKTADAALAMTRQPVGDGLENVVAGLGTDRDKAHRETAAMHRLETWRDRLLADGDDALAAFIAEYPAADRQRLRQLIRNALAERKADKPPHAFRELFRALREATGRDDETAE